jgi:hypothetical protein
MSTINDIKVVRDRLAKDVTESRKSYDQMVENLRTLSEDVKAAEATINANLRVLANLDSILRDAGQNVATKVTTKANIKTDKVEKTTKKADKAAVTKIKTKATRSLAAEGRRAVAEGLRPPIKDAIGKIMGSKTMTIDEIFEGLRAKSWLPNSAEPRQYIAYLLSTSKDRFERVTGAGRGVYRNKTISVKIETKTTSKAKAPNGASPTLSTDEILANSGVLGDAVFGG